MTELIKLAQDLGLTPTSILLLIGLVVLWKSSETERAEDKKNFDELKKQYGDLRVKYESVLIKVGEINVLEKLEHIIDSKFEKIINSIHKK